MTLNKTALPVPLFQSVDGVKVLRHSDYLRFLVAGIRKARVSIIATQFIVAIQPDNDLDGWVRMLCHCLAEAKWRGVDVRLVTNEFFVGNLNFDVNKPAIEFLSSRGVKVKQVQKRENGEIKSLHSKFAVIDGYISIVGSHNWTATAFSQNNESSIAIWSYDVAQYLSKSFLSIWGDSISVGEETHV